MKKKLLVLAIAGAFVAPVAMAEHAEPAATGNVNIYGQINASFDSVSDGAKAVASTSTTQVSDNASRLGFKGSEDLGGGTAAVWQLESAFAADGSNTATLGTRNTYVGLSGESWGTVVMGRHDTPYKTATRGLDLFADTVADNRSLMGMTGGGATTHDARVTDALAYISPAFSGVTVAIGYVPGAEAATAVANSKGSAWSLAAMYGAGPINASLSYQLVDGGNAPTNPAQTVPFTVVGPNNKATAWKVGGGYSMDAFTVNAVYERTTGSDVFAQNSLDQNNWYLAGKFNVTANDAVKLAYTHAGTNPQAVNSVSVPSSDAKQISIGYDHSMSKRTMVYALYTKLDNNTAAAYSLNPAAITGVTGGLNSGTADADPSAFSIGIKHSF